MKFFQVWEREFQFQVNLFGALYLPNKEEPVNEPLIEVVVLL